MSKLNRSYSMANFHNTTSTRYSDSGESSASKENYFVKEKSDRQEGEAR